MAKKSTRTKDTAPTVSGIGRTPSRTGKDDGIGIVPSPSNDSDIGKLPPPTGDDSGIKLPITPEPPSSRKLPPPTVIPIKPKLPAKPTEPEPEPITPENWQPGMPPPPGYQIDPDIDFEIIPIEPEPEPLPEPTPIPEEPVAEVSFEQPVTEEPPIAEEVPVEEELTPELGAPEVPVDLTVLPTTTIDGAEFYDLALITEHPELEALFISTVPGGEQILKDYKDRASLPTIIQDNITYYDLAKIIDDPTLTAIFVRLIPNGAETLQKYRDALVESQRPKQVVLTPEQVAKLNELPDELLDYLKKTGRIQGSLSEVVLTNAQIDQIVSLWADYNTLRSQYNQLHTQRQELVIKLIQMFDPSFRMTLRTTSTELFPNSPTALAYDSVVYATSDNLDLWFRLGAEYFPGTNQLGIRNEVGELIPLGQVHPSVFMWNLDGSPTEVWQNIINNPELLEQYNTLLKQSEFAANQMHGAAQGIVSIYETVLAMIEAPQQLESGTPEYSNYMEAVNKNLAALIEASPDMLNYANLTLAQYITAEGSFDLPKAIEDGWTLEQLRVLGITAEDILNAQQYNEQQAILDRVLELFPDGITTYDGIILALQAGITEEELALIGITADNITNAQSRQYLIEQGFYKPDTGEIEFYAAIQAGVPGTMLEALGIPLEDYYAGVRFVKDNMQLPNGEWFDRATLQTIQTESPELYTILTTQGYEAYVAEVDRINKEYEEFIKTHPVILKVNGEPDGYRMTLEEWNNLTDDQRIIGLTEGAAGLEKEYEKQATILEQLNAFKVGEGYDLAAAVSRGVVTETDLKSIFPSDIVDDVLLQIEALEKLADYKTGDNYRIVDFLMDKESTLSIPDRIKIVTDAGFDKDDVVLSLKQSQTPVPKMPSVGQIIWRSITPWEEDKKVTFGDFITGYYLWGEGARARQTQQALKAQFEANLSSPLWQRMLFGNPIIQNEDGSYSTLRIGIVPAISGAGVSTRGVKKILSGIRGTRKVQTIEINWNKLMIPRPSRAGITASQWNKIMSALRKPAFVKAIRLPRRIQIRRTSRIPSTVRTRVRARQPAWTAQYQKAIAKDIKARIRAGEIGIPVKSPSILPIITPSPELISGQVAGIAQATQVTPVSRLWTARDRDALGEIAETVTIAVGQPITATSVTNQLQLTPAQIAGTQSLTNTQIDILSLLANQPATMIQQRLQTTSLTQLISQVINETQLGIQIQPAAQTRAQALTKTAIAQQAATAQRPLVSRISTETSRIPMSRPTTTEVSPFKLPKGQFRLGNQQIPKGSITWAQGFAWYYIPPPYDQDKPIFLDAPPVGALRTGSNSPYDTIQVIGQNKNIPKQVSVDLGWADIFIKNGKEIQFKSGGEDTDVGARLPSTTKGMSVDELTNVEPYQPASRSVIRKPKKRTRLTEWEYATTLKGFVP